MVNNICLLSSSMKKLSAIFIGLILGFVLIAPASYADYRNFPPNNSQFHPNDPDYYDGNLRLKLKNRADIERASASNLHYDQYSRDYYRCNWKYNKNLRTWVCEKGYGGSYAQSIQACPFGYTFNAVQQRCTVIRLAANSRLNARGDGWVCNSGYHLNYPGTGCDRNQIQYTYYNEPIDQPTHVVTTKYVYVYDGPDYLPQTGSGIGLVLLVSGLGGYWILRRKKKTSGKHGL